MEDEEEIGEKASIHLLVFVVPLPSAPCHVSPLQSTSFVQPPLCVSLHVAVRLFYLLLLLLLPLLCLLPIIYLLLLCILPIISPVYDSFSPFYAVSCHFIYTFISLSFYIYFYLYIFLFIYLSVVIIS